MEIKSHYRPISIILSPDVPLILSEEQWAETIVARSREGHGMAFKIPRKAPPIWEPPASTAQYGVYSMRDSYEGSREEFPIRNFPDLESTESNKSRWSADSTKALEIKPESRLRRLIRRISQIF